MEKLLKKLFFETPPNTIENLYLQWESNLRHSVNSDGYSRPNEPHSGRNSRKRNYEEDQNSSTGHIYSPRLQQKLMNNQSNACETPPRKPPRKHSKLN